jgi:hypothetical protein
MRSSFFLALSYICFKTSFRRTLECSEEFRSVMILVINSSMFVYLLAKWEKKKLTDFMLVDIFLIMQA